MINFPCDIKRLIAIMLSLAIFVGCTTAFNKGVEHAKLGQDEEAIADFTEAIRLDPTDARSYQGRALCHERLENTLQADKDFAKAKELGYWP